MANYNPKRVLSNAGADFLKSSKPYELLQRAGTFLKFKGQDVGKQLITLADNAMDGKLGAPTRATLSGIFDTAIKACDPVDLRLGMELLILRGNTVQNKAHFDAAPR